MFQPIRDLFPSAVILPYIPPYNSWIITNFVLLMDDHVVSTDDVIQRLEDAMPSKGVQVPEIYNSLLNSSEEIHWKYMPSSFEKKRCTLIQIAFAVWYLTYASIGLVMPLAELTSTYSKPFTVFIIVFWVLYCFIIIFMDTEFNEMITLNASSISSFTYRLYCGAKPPKCVQCGSRSTNLNYRDTYPLFSFLYRTPNSTPAEYYWTRRIQGLVAKLFAYTDGAGGIQFPNNLVIRIPNVHDVEWAILQKHYQSEADASSV